MQSARGPRADSKKLQENKEVDSRGEFWANMASCEGEPRVTISFTGTKTLNEGAVVERLMCDVKRTSDVMDSISSSSWSYECLVRSLLSLALRVDR